ncbi:MAG: hypothetical protein KGQ88_09980, partial [Chloroflexi bacterium]|nr:hypothetical protein [Chloroflexota bacterium]
DPAFGLKRAAEQLQVALAPTAQARVQILAAQVQDRLSDLQRSADVPAKAPTATTEYEAAVQRFAAAVQALRRSEPAQRHDAVDQVVENARHRDLPVLEDLKERLPADAQQGIQRAIDAQEQLAPPSTDDHPPSAAPAQTPERERATEAPRESERPQATGSPRPRETDAPRATETQRASESPARATENPGD